MPDNRREMIERHIRTHSERSDEDRAAVSVLETFLRSNGKINTNFSSNDKWPNVDGTFEFVSNPNVSRRPEQNFFVQIKGSHVYNEKDGIVKYSLKSLAFPAFIYFGITLDPGLLFVVLNPDQRGEERVFWKYMSIDFINSINYANDSVTVSFTSDEEIKNTDESIGVFCDKLQNIVSHHSFVSRLDNRDYTKKDIEKIIQDCDRQISECIERMEIYNDTRDNVSKRIITRLKDLCVAVLLLNSLHTGADQANIRLAWERSLLNIETKYLGTFYKALEYIGYRVPDDGQSERLLLKYYNFLWQIRKSLQRDYEISILGNLEKFPLYMNDLDQQYYKLVANAINTVSYGSSVVGVSRFYVQKKTPFFLGKERYYEITLQLAGIYATKYNRITVYTKENISTSYSIQIGYTNVAINLWGIDSPIKIITNWKVSIDPSCLNKLAKILNITMKLNSKYGEYNALMKFLTMTGINLLDLIDLRESEFVRVIDLIYKPVNTQAFRDVLIDLKKNYSETSDKNGRNVIRYLLLNLREETIERVLPTKYNSKCLSEELYLSSSCFPFEKNPFISNLPGSKTGEENQERFVARAVGQAKTKIVLPYLALRNKTKRTGEIYFPKSIIASEEMIKKYNARLDSWEWQQGYRIKQEGEHVCVELFERNTIDIMKALLRISNGENKGQKEFNKNFIDESGIVFKDKLKEQALREAFVDSNLLLIYGAAGTGKTTLINYISDLMAGNKKLFLTKTHTALQNLKRGITNPGLSSDFVSIDSFIKRGSPEEYDIIFIDECSTIDNRTMQTFLKKITPDTFLVLAGDIYQIESIDFGNWFYYAKDIVRTKGANVELLNTWRTEDQKLISLWNEVRLKESLIIEKLAVDGPFSEDIGPNILEREEDDEIILCLNYDGKFGLNNMNNYFQSANQNGEAVSWQEWNYKVGDPILFIDTKRFTVLYNNLKGRIVKIEKENASIAFTVDVELILTQRACQKEELEFVGIVGKSTRIRFTVFAYDNSVPDDEIEMMRMRSVIPFQLAYAVSIHKAQGLEYDSVKVIIPDSNSEKISHGIFYTAITRAKKKLKIYWSSETMKRVIEQFWEVESNGISLDIVKTKLLEVNG